MYRLLALLIVVCLIAPALLARGGQMRQRERGASVGALCQLGAAKFGIEIRWRALV